MNAANPAGTDGFEFVEFAHPEPAKLATLLRILGFSQVARHKTKAIGLWRQGRINFLTNAEPGSHAMKFAAEHGPSAPSMGWRVTDAAHARAYAIGRGAQDAAPDAQQRTLNVPAITGIGGSLVYFCDRYRNRVTPYDAEFEWTGERDPEPKGAGLITLDHLTHNVQRGRMNHWADFYANLFGFKQIRYFDIEGKLTGLFSRAMTSPDGKIKIPINESADDKSQIEEYLHEYKGEGIQHIALGARDIYGSVDTLRVTGVPFMPPPPATYYEQLDRRVPGHGEPVERLRERGILIDGEGVAKGGAARDGSAKILLQIFSGTVLGPIFFEFIQRKGDEGFGEGNFRALFESIEEDQIRRGVLHDDKADAR